MSDSDSDSRPLSPRLPGTFEMWVWSNKLRAALVEAKERRPLIYRLFLLALRLNDREAQVTSIRFYPSDAWELFEDLSKVVNGQQFIDVLINHDTAGFQEPVEAWSDGAELVVTHGEVVRTLVDRWFQEEKKTGV